MDVSIIIVNYRSSRLVNDCIETIFEKVKDIEYEVIVVDNDTEDLQTAIAAHDDPRISLMQLPENVGFGRANNAGAQIAKGRNLFFLNPDTLLVNNAVKILSDYLDSHPECGVCGGNLYDAALKPMHSFRKIMPGVTDAIDITLKRRLSPLIYGKSHEFNYSDKEMRVGYITGADLMMPAHLFTSLHGFNRQIFLYYEETDLCKRISDKGLSIVSVPSAKIIHLFGQSHKPDGKTKVKVNVIPFVHECRSRKIYLNTHNPRIARVASRLILKLYYGLQYVASFISRNDAYREVKKARFMNV